MISRRRGVDNRNYVTSTSNGPASLLLKLADQIAVLSTLKLDASWIVDKCGVRLTMSMVVERRSLRQIARSSENGPSRRDVSRRYAKLQGCCRYCGVRFADCAKMEKVLAEFLPVKPNTSLFFAHRNLFISSLNWHPAKCAEALLLTYKDYSTIWRSGLDALKCPSLACTR